MAEEKFEIFFYVDCESEEFHFIDRFIANFWDSSVIGPKERFVFYSDFCM